MAIFEETNEVGRWDVDADGWRVAAGCYRVMVGRSPRRIVRHAELPFRGG